MATRVTLVLSMSKVRSLMLLSGIARCGRARFIRSAAGAVGLLSFGMIGMLLPRTFTYKVCVDMCFYFSGVNACEWDCWVIWEVYF